jgi:tetratricopeptide (TPR) repeat protein
MSSMTHRLTIMAALTVVAASPVLGMQGSDPALGVASMAPPPDRADALRAEAEALYSQPSKWRRAVRLLEQSAQLRTAADPDAYACWTYAARLRSQLGDYGGARESLERAADHALARGAVLDAAHAYIDAAHAAIRGRQFEQAKVLVGRAELLATSPQLAADEAAQITARLRV